MANQLLDSLYALAQRNGAVDKVLAESIKTVNTAVAGKWTAVDASTSTKGIVKVGSNINVSAGTISVSDGSTTTKGVVQLSSATNSTSTTLAATASAVKSAYDLANNAMPKTGGKFTKAVFENTVAMTNNTVTVSNGAVFTKTITAATTFTFTGVTSGAAATFSLVLTNGGAYTITWPSSVKWSNGSAPTLTSSGKDVLTFLSEDGGTTWYGVPSVLNAS